MARFDWNWWFGPNSFFGKLFGSKKPTTPPPAVDTGRPIGITTVPNARVSLAGVNEIGVTNEYGYFCWHGVPKSMGPAHLTIEATGYQFYSQHVDFSQGPQATNHDLMIGYLSKARETDILLPGLTRTVELPSGTVRADGRNFKDDDGAFFPLGTTLMWALRGWKFERDRVKENLAFVAKHSYDYVRILGEVQWPGNEIEPAWPDYEQLLGELIDCAYNEYGLRVQVTLIGGDKRADGSLPNYMSLAQKVARVVKSRTHMVYALEVANELYSREISYGEAVAILKYLRKELPSTLVSLSDNGSGVREGVGEVARMEQQRADGSTVSMLHLSRDDKKKDWLWRHVRQTWDYKGLNFTKDHNEPGGPLSSVAPYNEAIHLVWSRLVGIMNGVYGYVLHNGAGISGKVNTGRHRPANLWQTPNIDVIMGLVANVEVYVPSNIGDGVHTRKGNSNHPFEADVIWSDEGDHDHGCVRDYAVTLGNKWYQAVFGIKDHVVMTARCDCTVQLIDPMDNWHDSTVYELKEGQKLTIKPHARDSRGYGAIFVKGTKR